MNRERPLKIICKTFIHAEKRQNRRYPLQLRVHGGGFAGTIQAFVPAELVNDYRIEMNRIFGDNSCYILTIRPVGGIEITGDGDEGV